MMKSEVALSKAGAYRFSLISGCFYWTSSL